MDKISLKMGVYRISLRGRNKNQSGSLMRAQDLGDALQFRPGCSQSSPPSNIIRRLPASPQLEGIQSPLCLQTTVRTHTHAQSIPCTLYSLSLLVSTWSLSRVPGLSTPQPDQGGFDRSNRALTTLLPTNCAHHRFARNLSAFSGENFAQSHWEGRHSPGKKWKRF